MDGIRHLGWPQFRHLAAVSGIAAVIPLLIGSRAMADVLPPATASARVQVEALEDPELSATVPPGKLPLTLSISADDINQNPGSGSAAVSIIGGFDPSISASASAVNGGGCGFYNGGFTCFPTYSSGAQGQLSYDFKVSGPGALTDTSATLAAGSTVIPVVSTSGFAVGQSVDVLGAGPGGASLSATITGIDTAKNTLTIDTATSTSIGAGKTVITDVEVVFAGDSSASTSLSVPGEGGSSSDASVALSDLSGNPLYSPLAGEAFATSLFLDLGSVYNIDMKARASADSGAGELFSASAYVDPTLSISGRDAGSYRIAYSPGLLPNAVPEPGSLVLLATALAGLLAIERKGRRRQP